MNVLKCLPISYSTATPVGALEPGNRDNLKTFSPLKCGFPEKETVEDREGLGQRFPASHGRNRGR